MKKLFLLLIVLIILVCSYTVCADSEMLSIVVDTRPVTYTDAYPFIENGRTMIPLRLVSESMQANVEYDDATGIITITRNGNCKTKDANMTATWDYIEYNNVKYENAVAVAIFQKDSQKVTVELHQGTDVIHSTVALMDVPAKIINGRTFIPARYVAYALGYGIVFDAERNRVIYHYKAKQIADFTKPQQYPHDYYSYNPMMMAGQESVYNYRAFQYRDGYANVKIIDGDNGWEAYQNKGNWQDILDGKITLRGSEMLHLNSMPVNYTFETKEYTITNKNTHLENFEIFAKMYEDKMGDKAFITKDKYDATIDRVDITADTYDAICSVQYINGYYVIGPDKDVPITDSSLAGSSDHSRMDYTMFYYLDGNEKIYFTDFGYSRVAYSSSKYNLLTLETFLGEMGERIWTMMDDYYMHTGPFYRGEVCIGTDFHQARSDFREVEINKAYCEFYGFEFVSSTNPYNTGDSYGKLTANYNGIEFSVGYTRTPLLFPQCGYKVTVATLPK